jgi:hypothetical protein
MNAKNVYKVLDQRREKGGRRTSTVAPRKTEISCRMCPHIF